MKQINIKFNEENATDMKVYRRIKFAAEGMTEYIRQVVLMDIQTDEMLYRLREWQEGAEADGEKD